jgi:hypothetical protein
MVARADLHSPGCFADADAWQLADPTTATAKLTASQERQRRYQGTAFGVGGKGPGVGAGRGDGSPRAGPGDWTL